MNRQIPILPEQFDICCIPPGSEEASVRKLHHLPEYIEVGVEEEVEADQPQQMVRNSQLQQSFSRHGQVQVGVGD